MSNTLPVIKAGDIVRITKSVSDSISEIRELIGKEVVISEVFCYENGHPEGLTIITDAGWQFGFDEFVLVESV